MMEVGNEAERIPGGTAQEVDAANLSPFLSLQEGACDILLIRHADALPGPETVVTGGTYNEQPLSSLGRQQSEALAKHWADVPLKAIYCSNLSRTQETAAPLARAHIGGPLPLVVEEGIHEVDLSGYPFLSNKEGKGEGEIKEMTSEEYAQELRNRNAEIIKKVGGSGFWSSLPGAEPDAEFRDRVTIAIDRIASRHPGERVAVVTHGGVINAYVAQTLGIDKTFFFPTINTGVTLLRVHGSSKKRVLFMLNDVSHLRAAKLIPLQ
jgi:probable phosphoglycerate mutase